MGDEGGVVGCGVLERYVEESGLQVDHAYPFGTLQLLPVPARIRHLVLVLRSLFVYRHDVLHHSISLPRLLSWDK